LTLERVFKNTIILTGILIVVTISMAVLGIADGGLKLELIEEKLPKGIIGKRFGDTAVFIITMLYLLVHIISLISMYKFYRIGRILFILSLVILFPLVLFDGPVLSTSTIEMLDMIGGMLDGAILVFLYFTPIKEHFLT